MVIALGPNPLLLPHPKYVLEEEEKMDLLYAKVNLINLLSCDTNVSTDLNMNAPHTHMLLIESFQASLSSSGNTRL